MAKDYYNLLGVEKGASADDIKKAYRKLAHQHHPDKQGGDEAKFKEINEAYQILGNEEKRKVYDQFGEAGVNGQGGGPGGMNWEDIMRQAQAQGGYGGGGVEFDLGDIFSDFFGGGARARGPRRHKGSDIQMDVTIAFEEAAFGVKKTLEVYRAEKCDHCKGNGAEPGTPIKDCGNCNGTGAVTSMQRSVFGAVRTQSACPECRGEGKISEKKCTTCNGTATQRKTAQLEVEIPAGIDDSQTIRITSQGEAGEHGGPSGDLYVVVHVSPSPQGWERHEDHVLSDARVPYATMVLGGKIDVHTLDGEVTLKIPGGTESGKVFRLRGKGFTKLHGSGRGDHLVTVHVAVPTHVSGKLKKAIKQLQDVAGDE